MGSADDRRFEVLKKAPRLAQHAYDEEVVWRAQIALRGEEDAPLGWVSLSAVREGVRLPILAKADAAAVTDAQTAKAAAEPEAEKVSPERRKRRRSLEHDEAYVPRRYSGAEISD